MGTLKYRSVLAVALLTALVITIGCGRAKKGTASELFQQAQELQKEDNYQGAVEVYRRIAAEFPETREGANSQFMVGFIYANNLKDYDQALVELNRFLEQFAEVADSGLVAGARFELLYLGKDIEEIPILSELGQAEVDTAVTEEPGTP